MPRRSPDPSVYPGMASRGAGAAPWLGAAVTFLAVLSVVVYVDRSELRAAEDVDRVVLSSALEEQGALLSEVIGTRLQLAQSLAAVTRADPTFATENFSPIANDLVSGIPGVLSLQLAPGAVVVHVTNPERNQAIIGTDLLASETDAPLARRAIDTGETVVQGPFPLAQGGRGLVARSPIYVRDEASGEQTFWGFSTVVLDFDVVLGMTQVDGTASSIVFDLLVRDADGRWRSLSPGETIGFDDGSGTTARSASIVERSIDLPWGSWTLTARRDGGLPEELLFWRPRLWAAGLLMALVVATAVYTGLRRPVRLRRLVEQATVDLREARDQADRARASAEEASAAKSRLLRRASHELKTPLNAIIGFSDLMRESRDTEWTEGRKRMNEHVLTSARELSTMVDGILELAGIDAGRINPTIDVFDANGVARDCANLILPGATEKSIEIGLSGLDEPRFVEADIAHLRQIIMHLLANAVTWTPSGGSIEVASDEVEPGVWRFEICNSGPGLTAEQQEDLFEPFERLQASNDVAGHGLGLAISKALVESMDGHIGVHSEKDEGTTFWISLPSADPPPS